MKEAPPSLTKNAVEITPLVASETKPWIALEGSTFVANGHPILTQVPCNIVAAGPEKAAAAAAFFVGFDAAEPRCHHVAPVGRLRGIRFMSIFRFKVWWTTHWLGTTGGDVEHETQIMMLDKNDVGRPYVLLLPLIDGPFRASLQPGVDDYVDVCVESGSSKVCSSSFRRCLYMHAGDDPYVLIKEAMREIRIHLGTFKLLEEKDPPGIVDKFGWCTWDGFYLKVHPSGVREGVKSLVEGGCPPGLVLIDDGWQSICHDDDPITDQEGINRTAAGEQMPCRLIRFEENYKFRDYRSPRAVHEKGIGAFVRDLKEEFGTVEHVYVWHALCGYWGGVRPDTQGMPESQVVTPELSPGLKMTMEDLAVEKIVNNGIGLVPPEMVHEMYDGLHSHLRSAGIDGVKIDVIHLLEMLAEDFGGRVELGKAYYKALTASVRKNFKGNSVIASMEHCNDFMFLGTETISLGRVGDDFWCTDPSGDPIASFWLQGCHMVHCAYNSLWIGNFMHPDWDMFQSTHPCADFHAASRAISGGPVYVSDHVGQHNFQLLRSLVLPDGSILRCQYHALPTRDRLFDDPVHDGKTMLKIWNVNKYSGVVGLFNCQGGGWCRRARTNKCHSEFSKKITCTASPEDVEWKNANPPMLVQDVDVFAVFLFQQKRLELLKPSGKLAFTLQPFDYELLTVSPVTVLPKKPVQFAPIGLVDMFNTGGAVQSLEFSRGESSVRVGVRGCGEMRVFASERPKACKMDGVDVKFGYGPDMMMVSIQVPWPGSSKLTVIEYSF